MLIPPPKGLPWHRPSGILLPTAAAIQSGLSFAHLFNSDRYTFLLRGAVNSTGNAFKAGAGIGIARGGLGMKNANGWWGSTSANNTYSVNTTAGTIIVGTTVDFSPTDGVAHMLAAFGRSANYAGGPSLSLLKFSDNNLYFGWYSGSDGRVQVAASGIFASGDTCTFGLTWGPTGQVAYCKGKSFGTSAYATYGNTGGASDSDLALGLFNSTQWPWVSTADGAIHFCAIFDRQFTASEMAAADANWYWWAQSRPSASRVGVTAVTYTPRLIRWRNA